MYSKEQAEEKVSENIGSIEHLCKEAVCTADINLMLALGFPEEASRKICSIVSKRASELGIKDLKSFYEESLEAKRSNIINLIVRKFHKLYFATRANLHPIFLLEHIESSGNEDLCASLFNLSMGNALEMKKERRVKVMCRQMKKTVGKPNGSNKKISFPKIPLIISKE